MIGNTVFSDTMIRYSTLNIFGNISQMAKSKERFEWRAMTQIDNKFESTNQADHMIWWRIR